MGLLLLLASTLLSGYFIPWRPVDAVLSFAIREVTLSLEPSNNVLRGTNVTVRCRAEVITSGEEPLNREYTIYKDNTVVYNKIYSSSEDLLYPLPDARVSNSGRYTCKVNIKDGLVDKEKRSNDMKLAVTGLAIPQLHLNRSMVSEGEEQTVRCTAPGETGSLIFFFYEDSKEIGEERVHSNQAEKRIRFKNVGMRTIHCSYKLVVLPQTFDSEDSKAITVAVRALPIDPVLEIFPQYGVYEGDQLEVSCSIRGFQRYMQDIYVYLSQGTQLLKSGSNRVNHSMIALAKDSGELECRLEFGNVVKNHTKKLSVIELFSTPTITMMPVEVFKKELMTIICRSESYAAERISKEELSYSLDPAESALIMRRNGEFSGLAPWAEVNYTCITKGKDIIKHSKVLTVRPKVSVSVPQIFVQGKAILGRPMEILCESTFGSLPINYTLFKGDKQLNTTTVKIHGQKAIFTVTIFSPQEVSDYACEATNRQREGPLSKRLQAKLIVPVSHPTLTVVPVLAETAEGNELYLICGVRGSPPVTFKWYKVGKKLPLHTDMSETNNSAFHIPELAKEHSGSYYCEAQNPANMVVRSAPVALQVHLALWKKAVIGGFGLLVAAVLVVIVVLYFKSKRGKREEATELSVKPSSPKSDDSLTASLTPDTEVYKAAPATVDRARISVWTERPQDSASYAASDRGSSIASNEPDVEYTEVVHPQPMDPARVPLRRGTETVYSELQNSPLGAAPHHHYGSVEYAELNGEHPEVGLLHPEVNGCQDLPVPVD